MMLRTVRSVSNKAIFQGMGFWVVSFSLITYDLCRLMGISSRVVPFLVIGL